MRSKLIAFAALLAAVGGAAADVQLFGGLRGTQPYLWVSQRATCSDASATPHLSATPLCSLKEAVSRAVPGSIIAPEPGACYRIGSNGDKPNPATPGTALQPITIDGGKWGSGKACFRGSTAPAVSLVGGTIYRLTGTFSADPASFVYYVPVGKPAFYANTICSVCATDTMRLTKTAGVQTAPGVGEYGRDGTTIYVNAGKRVNAGEIEVPVPALGTWLSIDQSNWAVRNVEFSFFEAMGLHMTGAAGTVVRDTNIWFNGSDGIDLFGGSSLTCSGLFIAWNGRALGDAAHGDAISAHDLDTVNCSQSSFIHNDKSGNGSQSPSVSTWDRMLIVGNQPVWLANGDTGGGTMTVTNSVLIVPPGMPAPTGAKNTTVNALPGTLTVQYSTIYSVERTVGGFGVSQRSGTTTPVVVTNTIISGFATAVERQASGFTSANWACYNNGSDNCTGAILTDPQFVAAPTNLAVAVGSPMKAQAQVIPGITLDYIGAARSGSAPTIGAYE